MDYLFLILAVVLAIVCCISGQIQLTTEETPIQGKPFTFVCKTTTLSKTVTFFDPQSRIAGSCIFPEYNCDSGYDYKLSQNISALRTFFTIETLNRSLHQGNWKCKYGEEKAQMNLSVMTFPDRVHLEGLKNDLTLANYPTGIINITCSCSCSFPDDVMIGLSLMVGKSEYPLQSYTYEKQSIDPSYKCGDQLEKAYTSQFSFNISSEISRMMSMTARLKCYVMVSAIRASVFGMSVGKIIFPDSSTTPKSAQLENGNGTNVGAITGGVIGGLILVVLVVVVVCILIRRRNKKPQTSITRETSYEEITTAGTQYGSPYKSLRGNSYQSAYENNVQSQSQSDSNSFALSLVTRNNFNQVAQNMPEGTKCTFIRDRVTEVDGKRITDHNVIEFEKQKEW